MLIVVGDRDGECPAPQAVEMWLALNMHVPVYPDEGHGFSNSKEDDEYMSVKQPGSPASMRQ